MGTTSFETIEEAEKHGYVVRKITLKHASCWQSFLPGVAYFGYYPNKAEALEICSKHHEAKKIH